MFNFVAVFSRPPILTVTGIYIAQIPAMPIKNKKQVLILEQDKDLADSIRIYLEENYIVHICAEPQKLLERIAYHPIDVLLTGIDFPLANLRNLLHQIKMTRPEIKIIVMYMFFDADRGTENLILNDADDYIAKPFDVGILKNKLDKLLFSRKSDSLQNTALH